MTEWELGPIGSAAPQIATATARQKPSRDAAKLLTPMPPPKALLNPSPAFIDRVSRDRDKRCTRTGFSIASEPR